MDECNFGSIILPTLEEDLSKLAHRLPGVHLSMAKRWCKSMKLNIAMVFKYFTKKVVPLVGAKRYHHLSNFFLCILASFFLVHDTLLVDPRILHVVQNLGNGSLVPIILVETLKGLDMIHKKEATFFVGNPLLFQV